MKFTHIIGIDISKLTIDVCLLKQGKKAGHHVFENGKEGFKAMSKWLVASKAVLRRSLFCMEHTGCYGDPLRAWLNRKGYPLALESGFKVSRASEDIRGKTDRKDAFKIARYFFLRQEELELDRPRQDSILQLKALFGYRRRLVKSRTAIGTAQKELKEFNPEQHAGKIADSTGRVKETLDAEIRLVESQIQQLVKENEEIERNYGLATSVTGVGMCTAVSIIITTENFTRIDSPKKFACYVGIAPFPRQSGSSVRGKPKKSPHGDRQAQSELSMAASSAINHDPQIRAFYQRKTKQGKPDPVVRNAVMNKLVHRVYAVVKRGEGYVTLGKHAA